MQLFAHLWYKLWNGYYVSNVTAINVLAVAILTKHLLSDLCH